MVNLSAAVEWHARVRPDAVARIFSDQTIGYAELAQRVQPLAAGLKARGIGGGEKTPEARIRALITAFRQARYIDAYGLTETCSGDTLMEAGREMEKIGSCGRPTPHVQISIRDEVGAPLPTGHDGEICLHGPKVTRGYWRDPDLSAASFFGDWFRTGDVGYLDADGFLFLTDICEMPCRAIDLAES